MQIGDKADKNFNAGGTSMLNQLAMVQPQGPLAYTSYDFLKSFAWMLSLTKFIAHVFSLPIMVFLRRGFGMRCVDEVHILLSFVVWQIIGTLTVTATSESWLAFLVGALINLTGFAFVPMAIYHRRQAKQAALRGEGYSYYPGMPFAFWAKVPATVIGGVFRSFDWIMARVSRGNPESRVPNVLTHPDIVLNPERIQGIVRRFGEPLLLIIAGVFIGNVNPGFGVFLVWTAMMLTVNETLTQREGWEMYLDFVDAQVVAKEKERMLNDPEGISLTHGVSLARTASPRAMLSKLDRALKDGRKAQG